MSNLKDWYNGTIKIQPPPNAKVSFMHMHVKITPVHKCCDSPKMPNDWVGVCYLCKSLGCKHCLMPMPLKITMIHVHPYSERFCERNSTEQSVPRYG